MTKGKSVLTIPNDTSYLPVVRSYVMVVAAQHGFDETQACDIRLAVDEACTHVIETAFEPGEEGELTISSQRFSSGLRVTIADKGMPFDPGLIEEYDARGGLDRNLRGLPFYLIQQVMDEVNFVNKGREGKELQLTKYLEVPSVETYFSREELRQYDTEVEPAPSSIYEYRWMEPGDALEVSRCIYKTYGYTYPGEHVYFPERIVAMNQSGEMISAVAVIETGEVIGYCALSGHPDDPVMEIGQAVVVPAHRGRGVLKGLSDMVMGAARLRGLSGLFAQAVTLHPFSQRVTLKYGFRESALLLGYVHRAIQMKEISGGELPQRESVIYSYRPLCEVPCSRVYSPPHHRSMINSIYDNLGFEREFAASEDPGLNDEPSPLEPKIPHFNLSTKVVSNLGIATMEILNYGLGIEQEVKDKLRDLSHEEIAVIYMKLPLGDPDTAIVCQGIEELGFFFAGIQPGQASQAGKQMRCGDLLCLQYFNGPRINYDLLQLYSDFANQLAQYVRTNDPLS